jgi:hypothetical protein
MKPLFSPLIATVFLFAASAVAETVDLFNGKDFSGWYLYTPDKNADPAQTWTVKDGVIHCTGQPAGYIRTEAEYENYILRLEWRWLDKGGNSGALHHITGEDGAFFGTWPKSVEVQLGDRDAGDFWVIGGADFKEHTDPENRRVMKAHDSNEKPLGEWNRLEVRCDRDRIEVKVNGLLQNVATETTLTKGTVGLQSEGTPIEFRNIALERLELKKAQGSVYEDANGNGRRDSGEKGIPGVLVTNQRDLVETDNDGRYEIEVDDDDSLAVVKPANYNLPVDENNLPQFYYIHKPNGSSIHKYAGVAPTGPLPASIDFALLPAEKKTQFDVVVFGDPQPSDYQEVQYIRDDVVAEMIDEPAVQISDFGVTLGDVMNNDLSLYEPYNEVIGEVGKPWYNVIGNHDLNFDSPVDDYSDETWERVFGPNYSAFFHGDVLFLNLDNVYWTIGIVRDEKTGELKRDGGYIGLLGEEQIAWAEKVLAHHDPKKLVVIMTHIPLEREWGLDTQDWPELKKSLSGRKVLALAAHTHTQEHVFIAQHEDSVSDAEIHHLINVTVCGAWWKGRRDERGIPIATTSDGVDNGYTILSIDGADYTTAYKPSGKPWDYQIRIVSPVGHVKNGVPAVVNVLAGSSKSEVAYRIGEGVLCEMKRERMADPFMRHLWDTRDQNLKKAAQEPTDRNTHIWTAELPVLDPGTHTITIVEKDHYGNTHRQAGIFVVDE